ncbi:hypothetical protein [Stenomitos frigidus]|uniref:Uncharacterized protein n=1 Tax=Stenomitos frigidus ULC18 TaxID=2107698 RepID=A0A2T1DUR2_9CYAN|nr:hypothetical protein [Stenomitos frigidus]PSB24114.1 hypothetical protein C7B82_28225 [Stenomitos frigidus ULC18]
MTITTADMTKMSQTELDDLYKKSPIGALPDGDSQGTAMVIPGSLFSKVLMPLIKGLAWRGKVFHRDSAYLFNKVSPFGIQLVKAQIYKGDSWVDGGEAIVLDYSKTSFVAQKIRDEIREVAPGLYLGQAYWGKTRVLNFILEF